MANNAAQLFAYVLSFVGLLGLTASTFMTEWKTYARANGDATLQEENVGLWMKCTKGIAGQVSCTSFYSVFFQTREITICRGIMITSVIFCGLASLLAIFGLKCTKCLDTNTQSKRTVAIIAGALFILGGLCAFGGISWFAHGIIQDFHSESTVSNKYEFGNALFVGWSGAVLSIAGGAVLCISSRTAKQHRPYTAQAAHSKESGREYV